MVFQMNTFAMLSFDQEVLILFILEDGFSERNARILHDFTSCLNPFYSGRWFFSGGSGAVAAKQSES